MKSAKTSFNKIFGNYNELEDPESDEDYVANFA